MKGFLKFVGLVALFIPIWIAVPLIWGDDTPKKQSSFGVVHAIEQALAATADQREVSAIADLEPGAAAETWVFEGFSAVREELGVVSAQPFVAQLHTECHRYADADCWVVDQIDFPVVGDVAPDETPGETSGEKAGEKPGEKTDASAKASERDGDKDRMLVIQTQLTAMGFDIGTVDGVMGPRTQRALQDYADRLETEDSAAQGVATDIEVMGRLARGVKQHKHGDYHSAMQEYAKVLRLDPENVSARFNRGLVYRQVGATDLAIAQFDETLERRHDHEEALYERGNAHYDKDDYWAAFGDYADGFGWRVLGYRYAALKNQIGVIKERTAPEFEAVVDWAEGAWDDAKEAIADKSQKSNEKDAEEAS